jgi:cysteine desulfuration protein SufE
MSSLPTIEQLESDFNQHKDWTGRYKQLFALADLLPVFNAEQLNQAQRIEGCANEVLMIINQQQSKFFFNAYSDSKLIRGLIAVLLVHIQGKTADEIARIDITGTYQSLNLAKYVTSSRINGLLQVHQNILIAINR